MLASRFLIPARWQSWYTDFTGIMSYCKTHKDKPA